METGTHYSVTIGTCGLLAVGATCNINLTFSPLAPGTLLDTIDVVSDDPASPTKISVTGSGTGSPVAQMLPSSLVFSSQAQGSTSTSQPVTLTNTGTANLVLTPSTGVTFSGTNGSDFVCISGCEPDVGTTTITLVPNGSRVMNIAFTPGGIGSRVGTLNVVSNATTQTVSLTGTGASSGGQLSFGVPVSGRYLKIVIPGQSVMTSTGYPNVASLAELNAFDETGTAIDRSGWSCTADSSSAPPGDNDPPSSAVDGNNTTFWQTQYWGTQPAPPHRITCDMGALKNLTSVTLLMRQDGCAHGWIGDYQVFLDNNPDPTTQVAGGTFVYTDLTLACPGASIPPPFRVSLTGAPPLNFGNQQTNTSSVPKPVSIINSGTGDVSVTAYSVPTGFSIAAGTCPGTLPFTLTPNQSCQASVTFTPTMVQSYSGSVTVTASTVDYPFQVTGTGISSTRTSISVSPSSTTIPVNGTQTYTATDNLGSNVTNQCAWDTTNHSVATMSGNVATGLSGGSTNVNCVISSITGTANLAVSTASSTVFSFNFDSGIFPSGSAFSNGADPGNTLFIVDNSTVPGGCHTSNTAGDKCMKIHSPVGTGGGRLWYSPSYHVPLSTPIYFSFWVKFPTGFLWSGTAGSEPRSMKLVYFQQNDASKGPCKLYFEASTGSGGQGGTATSTSSSSAFYWFSEDWDSQLNYGNGPSITADNTWHQAVFKVDYANNATVSYWIDGVLKQTVATGPTSNCTGGTEWNNFGLGFYWNGIAPQTEDAYMDDVLVSTTAPPGSASLMPTNTLDQLAQHNGTAASGLNIGQSWVSTSYNSGNGFPGWTNAQTDTTNPVISNPVNAVPGNISNVSVHTLAPSSMNTLILAENQDWFTSQASPSTTSFDGQTYQTAGGHLMNGVIDCEESASCATIGSGTSQDRATAKVKFWHAVGIDGAHIVSNGNPLGCASSTPYVFGSTTFTADCGNSNARYRMGYVARKLLWAMQNADSGAYSAMKLLLMYEESAYKTASNCGTANDDQVRCVQAKMESDFSWFLSTFFTQPQYIRLTCGKSGLNCKANPQPVVSFFLDESGMFSTCSDGTACPTLHGSSCNTASGCWSSIWSQLRSYLNGLNITVDGNTYALDPWFLFRNASGFSHAQNNGAYAWIAHNNATGSGITTTTQEDWKGSDSGSPSYLEEFYDDARCSWSTNSWCTTNFPGYQGKLVMASVFKGFDPRFASWKRPDNTINSQRCGQTWLNTFSQIIGVNGNIGTANFGSGNPVDFIGINTWDDYEEGSEIETGIRNCYSLSASLSSSTLNWSLSSADPYASTSTLDHYAVWASLDGVNFAQLGSNLPVSTSSLDLSNALYTYNSGTYTLRVQAVGKPLIINLLSNSVTYVR